jgi:hypothetical protein
VAEKREQAHEHWETRRLWIALAGVGLYFAGKWPVWDTSYAAHASSQLPRVLWFIHIVLWIVLFVVWLKSPKMRPSKTRQWVQKQGLGGAPGFTDSHEKTALTVFGGVVAAKGAWDAHERRMRQQMAQAPRPQAQPPQAPTQQQLYQQMAQQRWDQQTRVAAEQARRGVWNNQARRK